MLSPDSRPIEFGTLQQELWDEYKSRLKLPDDGAIVEFYRQVVFDHFDHHNKHYPNFEIADYDLQIIQLRAGDLRDQVRYFGNSIEEVASWGAQFDEFEEREKRGNPKRFRYFIYEEMTKNLTFPFPPVLLDSTGLEDLRGLVYGRPLHLVEGTHRVGFLLRMLERGLVASESLHDFVLLQPKNALKLK